MSEKHDLNLTPVDVAEGRAVVVVCPDWLCGEDDLYRQVAQSIEEPIYTRTLRVRLTEHQWQVLKARALVLGQSTSEFVRRRVFDKR